MKGLQVLGRGPDRDGGIPLKIRLPILDPVEQGRSDDAGGVSGSFGAGMCRSVSPRRTAESLERESQCHRHEVAGLHDRTVLKTRAERPDEMLCRG